MSKSGTVINYNSFFYEPIKCRCTIKSQRISYRTNHSQPLAITWDKAFIGQTEVYISQHTVYARQIAVKIQLSEVQYTCHVSLIKHSNRFTQTSISIATFNLPLRKPSERIQISWNTSFQIIHKKYRCFLTVAKSRYRNEKMLLWKKYNNEFFLGQMSVRRFESRSNRRYHIKKAKQWGFNYPR